MSGIKTRDSMTCIACDQQNSPGLCTTCSWTLFEIRRQLPLKKLNSDNVKFNISVCHRWFHIQSQKCTPALACYKTQLLKTDWMQNPQTEIFAISLHTLYITEKWPWTPLQLERLMSKSGCADSGGVICIPAPINCGHVCWLLFLP